MDCDPATCFSPAPNKSGWFCSTEKDCSYFTKHHDDSANRVARWVPETRKTNDTICYSSCHAFDPNSVAFIECPSLCTHYCSEDYFEVNDYLDNFYSYAGQKLQIKTKAELFNYTDEKYKDYCPLTECLVSYYTYSIRKMVEPYYDEVTEAFYI